MQEGKNRQYLANYLHDNSESENIQDANIQLSHLKEAIQLRFIMDLVWNFQSHFLWLHFCNKEYPLTAKSLENDITILSADNHNWLSM